MSKAARIREMLVNGVPRKDICKRLKVNTSYISDVVAYQRNPEIQRAASRRYMTNPASRERKRASDRRLYVPAPKPSFWSPDEDQKLLSAVDAGITLSQIGKVLGRNRNQVAGRLDRLRKKQSAPVR